MQIPHLKPVAMEKHLYGFIVSHFDHTYLCNADTMKVIARDALGTTCIHF